LATTSAYNLNDAGACERYQSLWEKTRGIFASLRYARAVESVYGLKSSFWFADEDASLLVHLKGGGPLRRAVIPPFTQYSSLLLPTPPASHLIHRQKSPMDILLQCVEKTCRRADLLIQVDDPRTAQWRNWKVQPLFTYLIPLPSHPDDWSGTSRRTWRGKKGDYEIQENSVYAHQVIDLCRASYKRHGRSLPADATLLGAFAKAMGQYARTFVALRDGTIEAGLIILHDESTAHYWVAGSEPGPSMTVLIGEVLSILSASGISIFDFVGANTPSIAEFKRSFGPTLTQYYHLRRRPPFLPGR